MCIDSPVVFHLRQLILLIAAGQTFVCGAASSASPEFRLDLRGLGPWQCHTARASEPLAYSSAWATNAEEGAKAVVKVMPVLKTKPKYLVIDLSGGTSATHYPISYLDEVPGGSWSDEYKTSKLVLRHIPAGSFIMGGRATDYPGAVNTNLHMVTITRDFYMGVFEVTQRQWELVMGTRPSLFSNDTCYAARPVECVRWVDIRGSGSGIEWPKSKDVDDSSFLGVLQGKSGLCGLDLPTESQWEYACRAGTTSAFNNGKNASQVSVSVEMGEVGRYFGNSGIDAAINERVIWATNHSDCTVAMATAKAGSYIPNDFGLYDMHGNVSEFCLDVFEPFTVESVDPIGPEGMSIDDRRVYRGGSWWHLIQDNCTSGHRSVGDGKQFGSSWVIDHIGMKGWPSVGFRLCLHGGDVPDFAAASTLVNDSGAGSLDWTPTKAGTYYLAHSTMNGTTNAQVQSAWFEVPGCELMIEPQGQLTNGVSVAITGAGEGWVVYYTTNGLASTTASETYTGPFSLPKSTMVRAVAYNVQGVASEEMTTSVTLHDSLSVVGAVARQRYPWNGMVDVDCEIKGDPDAKYDVELVAIDLEGGTNLPVKTVLVDAMETIASTGGGGDQIALSPGKHRLVWNADADIARDGEFPQVAVTVKATTRSVLDDYPRRLTISTDGYEGSETLTGVPVLVRLSKAIEGFDYRDFSSPSNGADLAFFDANERELPYEIDEWHTNGESLVWVKLPEMKQGTRFTCAYGNDSSKYGRAQDAVAAKHEVWADYAGVWHMNEDSGTAFDSTEHGLDALPDWGTNKTIDVRAEMKGVDDGAVGRSRQNEVSEVNSTKGSGNFMIVPSHDALSLGGQFVCEGWFKAKSVVGFPRMISRKNVSSDRDGWELHPRQNSSTNMSVRGSAAGSMVCDTPDFLNGWVSIVSLYDGVTYNCYTNGVLSLSSSSSVTVAVCDNGLPVAFGCNPSGNENTWCGWYDEIRLRGGSLSADRIKADYDMIANRAFCTYGAVKQKANKTLLPADATGAPIGIVGDVLVIDVSAGSTASSYPTIEWSDVDIGTFNCDVYKTDKIVLKKVPAGSYFCQPGADEKTVVSQKLTTKGFYIGVFPVTQRQYERVMGSNPSYSQTDASGNAAAQRPVEQVSWNTIRGSVAAGTAITASSADSFMKRLVAKTGLSGFDLPTEAQWEMACRAGSTAAYGSYCNGSVAVEMTVANIGDAAWYYDNSSSTTHAVGEKKPNLWGLYDTQGNVWEWCRDIYISTYSTGYVDVPCTETSDVSGVNRVERGGVWYFGAEYCRPSDRGGNGANGGYRGIGFRLSRALP